MVSPGLIRRIARFNEALRRLKKLAKYDILTFKSDFRNVDSAERNLEVAIQALIDVGNQVIARLNLGTPMKYRDIAEILFREGIIGSEEYRVFRDIIGFRHILVHLYADVDIEKIYEIITQNLDDLRKIMESIIRIIKERKIDP